MKMTKLINRMKQNIALPKTLIRLKKLLLNNWAKLISSPFFGCIPSKPDPLTGLFIRSGYEPRQFFMNLDGDRSEIPSVALGFWWLGFNVVASSNGLLCFSRERPHGREDLLLCNPVTQQWAIISELCPPPQHPRETTHNLGFALLYDPAKSFHYKAIEVMLTRLRDDNNQMAKVIYFNIFSSETRSWRVSSEFPLPDSPDKHPQIFASTEEGTVCWWDEHEGCMIGYDIANDTCCKAPLPSKYGAEYWMGKMMESKGQVYYVACVDERVKVWRLEKAQWILEGRWNAKNLWKMHYAISPLAYDAVQGKLILEMVPSKYALLEVGVRNIVVYHLPSLRWEVACEGVTWQGDERGEPYHVYPHYNTLAKFHIEVEAHGREEAARAGHGFKADALQRFMGDWFGFYLVKDGNTPSIYRMDGDHKG